MLQDLVLTLSDNFETLQKQVIELAGIVQEIVMAPEMPGAPTAGLRVMQSERNVLKQ